MNLGRELTRSSWADFPTRVITALIGAPLVVVAIVVGSPAFDILILGLAGVAAYEINQIVRPQHKTARVATFVGVFAIVVFFAYLPTYSMILPILLVALAFSATRAWNFEAGYLLSGMLYVGLPLALLLVVRSVPNGLLWIMALTWGVWVTDTMALIGGRLFGQHKLAPDISPGKTIEGAAVGILAGMSVGFTILLLGGQSVAMAMSLSAAVSGMAVVGDLFESIIKRHFGVKDSSNILPGHGGVLDRIDGILGATPVFYLILLAFMAL